tara:strand:- start:4618 stop:5505 length:888 start_codon:yes stop_codon:yes gene_type:complete
MLAKLKVKFEWYSNRIFSEVYLKKVKLLSRYKNKVKAHTLPQKLVISLTSYRLRFVTLYPTILSLIQQDIAPDIIVLWVSKEDYNYIPENIMKLQGRVNDKNTVFVISKTIDFGPYTKIIPALERYSDFFIVTADDDIYYPNWWLKLLLKEYNGNNKEIICYLAHEITLDLNTNTINPYGAWIKNKTTNVDSLLGFPLGVGGVLYPPASLHELVTNDSVFLKESPMADDIWLFWMARKQGSVTKKTSKKFKAICWPDSQKIGLLTSNVNNNKNDKKIKNMLQTFGWPIKKKRTSV